MIETAEQVRIFLVKWEEFDETGEGDDEFSAYVLAASGNDAVAAVVQWRKRYVHRAEVCVLEPLAGSQLVTPTAIEMMQVAAPAGKETPLFYD